MSFVREHEREYLVQSCYRQHSPFLVECLLVDTIWDDVLAACIAGVLQAAPVFQEANALRGRSDARGFATESR